MKGCSNDDDDINVLPLVFRKRLSCTTECVLVLVVVVKHGTKAIKVQEKRINIRENRSSVFTIILLGTLRDNLLKFIKIYIAERTFSIRLKMID